MERIKGERIELQSDGAEKHDQHRLKLGRFDVEKIRFFFKHALGRSSKLCFLCGRGAHFQKNRENKLPESAKRNQKILDGKYDGYMRGLDGAEKRRCWTTIGFTTIFWGSRLEIRPRRRSRRPWLGGLGSSKKCDFWLKMLYAAISNCASCAGGEHIFRQIIKRCCQNVKNGVKIISDTSKCHQHGVAYMKMSLKMMSDTWFKSSKEATCRNNTHICDVFWGPAWGAWSG